EEKEILQVQKEVNPVKEIYDLSLVGCFLIAQSRRAMTISSRWLRREGVGGINDDGVERFDPILGLNLEGDLNFMEDVKGDSSKVRGQMKMEHGSEDCPIEGGNGKKRPSRKRRNCNGSFVVDFGREG
ncbi:hypothetical protein Gorai_002776, partial [Gossypium raimondii]|nr:hypothetical protein [Gossypium raimondii]